MTEARSDHLCWISGAEKPGASVGTTKPRMPSSVRAHTTATSATEPLVIHILRPVEHPVGAVALGRGCVMPAGSEPWSGSVSPKQPITSPAAIRGSHCCFCSSEPKRWMAYIASEPCTETSERMPESAASSSRQASPYCTARRPAQP